MLKKLSDLVDKAKLFPSKKAAVVVAEDDLVLEGVLKASQDRLIIPVLIGDRKKISSLISSGRFLKKASCVKSKSKSPVPAKNYGLESHFPDNIEIIDAANDSEAAYIAASLAAEKKIDIIIKGHIHTDVFMHQLISRESRLRTNRFISHIFVMEIKTYKKLLLITDAAININPGIPEKAQILQNAIDFSIAIGIEKPKAALLSAVETVNPKIVSTVDAAVISKMADRGQITGGIVDGPLAFDNVISSSAAKEKGIKSSVAGDADIIIVPNIESGNILFKDLEYLAGAKVAGVVVGLSVPVVLTSRSDNMEARLYSTAVAMILSENYKKFLEYKAWV